MTQSLYRKYRPQRFAELVGQEHITVALRNGVRDDRVGHAYLFTGPRGTGKTTTARILAKALNCLNLSETGEPCGECENCTAIANGTFFDMSELDAASNNGVENVRDLIQSVNLGLGATAKQKVYLIDEVHMLTGAASNALLKTLEEPPPHVVFILATTDPQKVLPTIRSRTQQFDFRLFTAEELTGLLADVLQREGVTADDESLNLVARRGAGSARDSLSLLDQALALGAGSIDAEQVKASFGGTAFDDRAAILNAVGADDPAGAIVAVQRVLMAGIEPRRLGDDLLGTVRDAFVHLAGRGQIPYDGPGEDVPVLAGLGESLGAAGLTRCLELLGAAIVDIRSPAAPDPRLILEVAVVRCARRDSRTPLDALLERVERLEQRVAAGGGADGGGGSSNASSVPAPRGPSAPPRTPPAPENDDASMAEDRPPLRERSGLGAFVRDHGATPPASGSGSAMDAPKPLTSDPAPAPMAAASAAPEPKSAPEFEVAPEGGPEAAPATPATGASFSLDDAIIAWGNTVGALSPPLRAVVQEAQPIAVEDGTIVFGVPPLRAEAINKRFRAEADAIKHGLATHLGAPPALKLRSHDFDAPGALRAPDPGGSASGAGSEPAAPTGGAPEPTGDRSPEQQSEHQSDDELMVDLADLIDAPDAEPPVDSATRLLEAFGGEIVEERPRR